MNLKNALWSAILLAGAAINGCTNPQQPDPAEYKLAEGLRFTTFDSLLADKPFRNNETETSSAIVCYSDSFPVLSLYNATVTICFLTDQTFLLLYYQSESNSWTPAQTIKLWPTPFIPAYTYPYLNIEDCGDNGYVFTLQHYIPKDGDYDFYLKIENTEEGIYYKTHNLRYTVITATDEQKTISTNISIIP